VRKESNVSGAKGPWARMVEKEERPGRFDKTVRRGHDLTLSTNHGANQAFRQGMHAMA
jgi:hypothetical protein